jgi:hypothetical protein
LKPSNAAGPFVGMAAWLWMLDDGRGLSDSVNFELAL